MQYGGRKVEKSSDFDKKLFLRGFSIVDCEPALRFSKIKIADPRNFLKICHFDPIRHMIRFMMSLITDLPKNFRNSRWRLGPEDGEKSKNNPM